MTAAAAAAAGSELPAVAEEMATTTAARRDQPAALAPIRICSRYGAAVPEAKAAMTTEPVRAACPEPVVAPSRSARLERLSSAPEATPRTSPPTAEAEKRYRTTPVAAATAVTAAAAAEVSFSYRRRRRRSARTAGLASMVAGQAVARNAARATPAATVIKPIIRRRTVAPAVAARAARAAYAPARIARRRRRAHRAAIRGWALAAAVAAADASSS